MSVFLIRSSPISFIPLYHYTIIPLYLYTPIIPLYPYTFIPLYLYTLIPLYPYTFIPLYPYTFIPLYLYIPQGRYRRLFLAIRINPLYQVLQTKPHLPEFQQLLNSRRQFLLLFQNMNLNPINYGQ